MDQTSLKKVILLFFISVTRFIIDVCPDKDLSVSAYYTWILLFNKTDYKKNEWTMII